jgi:hypothetical protein
MARGQTMKAIEEAIIRLEGERAAFLSRIDGRIEGLREALRLHGGESQFVADPLVRRRARRGNLKETVLGLAGEVEDRGLTAEGCVAMAKGKGIDLVQGSVSSLLSRLKNDGVMFFDGQVYRLKQYAGPKSAA